MPRETAKISEKGFAPIFFIIALTLLIGSTTAASQIPTTAEYPENVYQKSVLGDESSSTERVYTEEEKKYLEQKAKEAEARKLEENKEYYLKKMELKKEEEKKKLELKKEDEKKKLEVQKKEKVEQERKLEMKKRVEYLREQAEKQRSPKPIVEDDEDSSESAELENELALLEKELKEDDGKVEYEQKIGDLKMKYLYENGKLVIKAKAENGAEIEVNDAEVQLLKTQLEDQLRSSGIEIASSSSRTSIGKNRIKAKTNFPVSVDPETNQLTVSTPAGQKVVTVLPDQAVQNMLSKNILSEVEYENESTGSGELESQIELENRNDQVVYKVKGKKDHKLLGFIPVKTDTTAYVSAENGEVVAKDESLLSRLVGYLSF